MRTCLCIFTLFLCMHRDPESKGQIPYVSTAFGKSWKLLQDPTLPESVAPTRVYRVDGYCPHSYDGKDGLRDPVEDPRAIQHRETPQLSLPLPAFAEQEYDEAAAAELESGQPGLLVKGFPTSLSEAEVAAAFGCTGERPKASLFSRHGLEASTNGEDKSQGSVGTSAVFAFDRACHAAYALHHAKDSEVLKSAMIQFGQVGVLEALVQNPSLTNRDSAVKDADDEFVLAAPVARNMGFPSRIGPAGVSAKNSMLSFSVGIGKVGLGKTKRERQASPPRPDGRPEDDASTVHQDKRNASPPRPVTRDETLHPSASGHGAGSHVGSARSPARADRRTSSPARPERERAGDGSSEGAALAAPGSALASAIDKDAEILLQIQCAELEGTGVSASGIKALREVHKELRVAALSALKKAVAAGRAAASRDELWTQVLSETMLDLVGAPPPMPPHEDAPPPPPPQYPDAPAPPHGQAQHGGHPPQQQPSAPPGAHAPYGHTGEMHAQAAYGGGSGGHEWGATGGMMPAASSGPHAPHHAAYAHPPHYPHDHRPHQYPAGGEMMHTHQHPPPHYHGPPPHYDGPPQHFNEGPPYSEGPRQHHPHPSHHHPGPTFPDSQHGSGPPGPYHGPPNGPRGHGPPPHYGPGGHGAYHHKTHHHQGPPYHHDHPPMNMHGPPAGGGGPYGPGGPGGPGPGGPPGPGPPPHMGPGRPRDLHEMLEAQFRHAGQRLADLDHDALESLKAMDEPCQQAAVKVALFPSLPGFLSSNPSVLAPPELSAFARERGFSVVLELTQ